MLGAISTSSPTIDLAAVKGKQQAAWSAGDYAVVGTTLQIVGETLCETLDLRAGERVLDIAAGNGNATLAAARRWADVTYGAKQESLAADLIALAERFNRATDGSLVAPSQYAEVVIKRR